MTQLDYIEKRNELIKSYMSQLNREYKNVTGHKVILNYEYTFCEGDIYKNKILFRGFKLHHNTICLAYYELRNNNTYIREPKYIEIDYMKLSTLKIVNL